MSQTFLQRCTAGLLAALLFAAPAAQADIDAGLDWLADRDSAQGVHRPGDITTAADTNAEAWLTVHALGAQSEFPGLADATAETADESLFAIARQAVTRLQQGLVATAQIDTLLLQQQADGGFPSHADHASDPITTAWALMALDRAGRGAQTPAQRALGYLIAAQRSDGGWVAVPGGDGAVLASATAARALASYANRFNVQDPLNRARGFLLAQRNPDAGFGDLFETAAALEALIVLAAPRAQLTASMQALADAQQANGSFADDAFETALALRALWTWDQPVIDPELAAITGRVLAADTDLPITGATFTLTGAGNFTLVSNNAGQLANAALSAGSYTARLEFPGMHTLEFTLNLVGGRTLDLGDIRMYQGNSPGMTFGIVRGIVTSAETGLPVPGAVLRMEDPPTEVVADADGRYQFLQVPVGDVRITAEALGYCTIATVATIEPLSVLELSVRLTPRGDTPLTGALVRGVVRDGDSENPLDDVTVRITDGAPPVSTQTAANGAYELEVDANGIVTVLAEKPGYDPVTIRSLLVPDQILAFSPRMYPTGTTPDGANSASIRGTVVNQANRLPIANALIVVTDPSGQQSLRSDSEGRFVIDELTGPTTRIAFSADAFDPATLIVPILPLEVRDVGVVGLKPTALEFYFPDLAIVGSTLAETEPDTFSLAQEFEVEVANRGTAGLTQDFTLLAFVDANGNQRHDEGLEPEVGRVRVTDDLPIGGAVDVRIAVTAQLNFRDAPVAFVVDVEQEVPEQDEDNNTGSSLLGCRVTPAFIGSDTVYEAWRWSGLAADPTVNSLNQVPVVGQLTDDNGDGVINEYDIPDIVFVAGTRSSSTPGRTALVAISGDDGRELWTRTDIRLSHFTSLALGDIDNDGVAEIVAVRNYREELIAFENDGTLKWRRALNGPGMPVPLLPPPPYVYDTPLIVNLEGDNEGEIILGREAFRGFTGEQLWEGEFDAGGDGGKPMNTPLVVAYGIGSISADLNMDGIMEVIAGRSVYDADGRTVWHRDDIKDAPYEDNAGNVMNASGYNAIGNFDIDDFPEIVLAIDDELWLLNHDGSTIWGPKYAPDFGQMGAPSVADLDDDGLPEIMISSNERLTVFESDGTVKWTATIEDNSGVTSATVFDFENDGLYEVVHMDEKDLRIFDALTGARLYETRNTSRTVYELPVIADIDGDKQAEIIITGFDDDFVAGTTPGIRVFKARNGAWADAGSVWGSQSFHINEINEDSTLPLIETPSWLTHNTYRVQRSPLPDPLGMPDFSVGDLRLIEQGPGNPPAVQVRVGNAGPVDAHEPPYIGIYRGDPADGGVLLAETRLDTLRPSRFQIVNLPNIAIAGTGDLYAVVDARDRANECREGNNMRVIPFSASNGDGELALASDAVSYRPGTSANFTATVENAGALPADFSVELHITNAQNQTVATFDALPVAALPAAASQALQQAWYTGDALGGSYTLRGQLRDGQGTVVDTAALAFQIAGNTSAPSASLRLVTDKASYRADEPVDLHVLAQNLSDADIVRAPQIVIDVTGPTGNVQQRTFVLDDLFPGARFETTLRITGAAAAGTYLASGVLRSTQSGSDLADDDAPFERVADAFSMISGNIAVLRASLTAGDPQTCLVTLRNRGSAASPATPVRLRVAALDAGAVLWEQEQSIDLDAGSDHVQNQPVATGALLPGAYACVLETREGAGWRILDSTAFTVVAGAGAGIDVVPLDGLVTTEAGQVATFTVALRSQPTAAVTIAFESSDTGEFEVLTPSVTISPATWSLPRTVTVRGVDDDLIDGEQAGTIRVLPATSTDAGYDGLDAPDVGIVNQDDDGVSIVVAPPGGLQVDEGGATATFAVSLSDAPDAEVRIPVRSLDGTEFAVDLDAVVFPAGETGPVVVTVTGVDDALVDGNIAGFIELGIAVSADTRYAGIDPADVAVTNIDDDTAQILATPVSLVTDEDGSSAVLRVRLGSAPTAAVQVALVNPDPSEWSLDRDVVVFDPADWEQPREVVVTGVDDDELDGDIEATLVLSPATSADPAYDGIDPADIALRNRDNDSDTPVDAALVVDPRDLQVSEAGDTGEVRIALSRAPTGPVTLALQSDDTGEVLAEPAQLVFTPANGTTPQSVLLRGVDDDEADGDRQVTLRITVATSDDPAFAVLPPRTLTVGNLDDDTPRVRLQRTGPASIVEGDTTTFALSLGSRPVAAVDIALQAVPDAPPQRPIGDYTLSPQTLRIEPDAWNTPVTITLATVDDSDDLGDYVLQVQALATASDDPLYAALASALQPVAIEDNDDAPLPPALPQPVNIPMNDLHALWLLCGLLLLSGAWLLRRREGATR